MENDRREADRQIAIPTGRRTKKKMERPTCRQIKTLRQTRRGTASQTGIKWLF